MLTGEQCIEQALNEAGAMASAELLKRFDTDGGAIQMGTTQLTSKGLVAKQYQTPYGEIQVNCHLIKPHRLVLPIAHWNVTPESSKMQHQNWRKYCHTNTQN